jgi:hypothetical protein
VELPCEKAESRQREGAAHLPSAGFLLTVNFWSIAWHAARSCGSFFLGHVSEKSESRFSERTCDNIRKLERVRIQLNRDML